MKPLALGRLRVTAVVERAGPTRPTWLLPDATPEATERHREWLAPHFLDERGRFLPSIHAFVVRAPGLTVLVDVHADLHGRAQRGARGTISASTTTQPFPRGNTLMGFTSISPTTARSAHA